MKAQEFMDLAIGYLSIKGFECFIQKSRCEDDIALLFCFDGSEITKKKLFVNSELKDFSYPIVLSVQETYDGYIDQGYRKDFYDYEKLYQYLLDNY